MQVVTSKKGNTTAAIVCLVIAIIALTFAAGIFLIAESDFLFGGEPDNINRSLEKWGGPKKGEHVVVEVDACLINYAETKHRINGFIPAGTDQHFIIWLDDNGVISVKVKSKKLISRLKDIIDGTWSYIEGTAASFPASVKIQGEIRTLDPEIERYFSESLREMGFTGSGFPIYHVEIDTTATKTKTVVLVLVFVAFDVLCMFLLVRNIKERKAQKNMSDGYQ